MKVTKKQLYKRQTTLTEIGEEGQQKLLQTKVIVVGCGGLGSVAAVYLAASGIGNIHLIDFDIVDASNLHRQVFYKTEDIGQPKSEILAQHIEAISPFVTISFSTIAITNATVL
jgi:adenylyltransferase/sulfurtransferase